jgi:hypothetical protein
MIEGVDYSSGAPGSAALLAAGKHFVVRYLARDWRGITPQERAELESGGIDIAVVYESTEQRPLDGREAGADDARFAQDVLVGIGLPASMPIYFAADWDFSEDQQARSTTTSAGCADSIGADRVGIYGGFHVIGRCHANGTAKWFWQTSAWSGGMLQPWAHLYQYAYNVWINGTNCDACQALQDTYGQASTFQPGQPHEVYAAAKLPPTFQHELEQPIPTTIVWKWHDQNLHLYPARQNVQAAAQHERVPGTDRDRSARGAAAARGGKGRGGAHRDRQGCPRQAAGLVHHRGGDVDSGGHGDSADRDQPAIAGEGGIDAQRIRSGFRLHQQAGAGDLYLRPSRWLLFGRRRGAVSHVRRA